MWDNLVVIHWGCCTSLCVLPVNLQSVSWMKPQSTGRAALLGLFVLKALRVELPWPLTCSCQKVPSIISSWLGKAGPRAGPGIPSFPDTCSEHHCSHQLPGTWGFGWHRSAHQPCVRVPGVNLCLLSCFLPGLFGSSSRSTSFELFIEGYPSPLEQLCCFLLSCAVPMSLTGLGKLWVAPADGQRWWSMPPSCHGRGERSRPDQYNYLGAEQMKKHSYSQSCCPQSVARVLFPGGEIWRSHIVPALHRVISAAQVGAVAGELGVCGCCRHEVFRPFPSCPHLSAPRFARPRFHASFQPLSSTFRLSLWWWL